MIKEKTPIKFTLNGKEIAASPDSRLLDIIETEGFQIPHLCFNSNYRADGNCRSCVVEISGEKLYGAIMLQTTREWYGSLYTF